MFRVENSFTPLLSAKCPAIGLVGNLITTLSKQITQENQKDFQGNKWGHRLNQTGRKNKEKETERAYIP